MYAKNQQAMLQCDYVRCVAMVCVPQHTHALMLWGAYVLLLWLTPRQKQASSGISSCLVFSCCGTAACAVCCGSECWPASVLCAMQRCMHDASWPAPGLLWAGVAGARRPTSAALLLMPLQLLCSSLRDMAAAVQALQGTLVCVRVCLCCVERCCVVVDRVSLTTFP
jgi:hypothetical protein